MAQTPLPDHEHAVRLVRLKGQRLSEDGTRCVGFLPQAFDLREGEDYLSMNCMERAHTVRKVALGIIKTKHAAASLSGKLGATAVFAIGVCKAIKDAFLPHKVRVVHDPIKADPKFGDDPSYGAVRQFPKQAERQIALEKLAASAWAEIVETSKL